jgi:hypothetical protein
LAQKEGLAWSASSWFSLEVLVSRSKKTPELGESGVQLFYALQRIGHVALPVAVVDA